MKFGHLEQKLELSNQNMCKKFFKNNAHILRREIIPYRVWIIQKIDELEMRISIFLANFAA
jgi:hypothetical protein